MWIRLESKGNTGKTLKKEEKSLLLVSWRFFRFLWHLQGILCKSLKWENQVSNQYCSICTPVSDILSLMSYPAHSVYLFPSFDTIWRITCRWDHDVFRPIFPSHPFLSHLNLSFSLSFDYCRQRSLFYLEIGGRRGGWTQQEREGKRSERVVESRVKCMQVEVKEKVKRDSERGSLQRMPTGTHNQEKEKMKESCRRCFFSWSLLLLFGRFVWERNVFSRQKEQHLSFQRNNPIRQAIQEIFLFFRNACRLSFLHVTYFPFVSRQDITDPNSPGFDNTSHNVRYIKISFNWPSKVEGSSFSHHHLSSTSFATHFYTHTCNRF